ncbi:unnamed protein product [Durusdinium trenchii]|uniref:Uncharacterized protein n=1 Tax=Durusdinium trenchii TaxID=1381693 RepID=A0ABP0JDH7_9DINO
MVLEALGAAVSGAVALGTSNWDMWGMTGGLATSGRGAQVDQAFQRKHDRIDYKVTRQGLHRDDISDLIQLTTGRMDMYNLVGALLLTFALRWITSSDLVVVPDFPHWPVWYSTVFVIACFSSVGYLIFSLWFAMHCSITAQALGTRMRLNFTRLSVPDNSTISKLKVPFFIPGGALEKVQKTVFDGSLDGVQLRKELVADLERGHEVSAIDDDLSTASAISSHRSLPAYVSRPSEWRDHNDKNDDDKDFEKHLRRWIRLRGHWLGYDAYARACMVVGMNQMLQALTYHVVAVCWKVSAITAFACLALAKLLTLCVLRIDVNCAKPYTCLGYCLLLTLEVAPPFCATILLVIYTPGVDWDDWIEGALAFPIFLMHCLWTLYLASQLSPADEPVFKGADPNHHCSSDEGTSDESMDDDLERHHEMIKRASFGLGNLPRRLQGARWLDIIRLEQPVPRDELEEEWIGVDPLPGQITLRFTLTLAGIWVCAGLAHMAGTATGWDQAVVINCDENNCTGPGNTPVVWPHARPRPHHRIKARRLRSVARRVLQSEWPAPASLFQVNSLHCGRNASEFQLFVHNGFDFFGANRVADELVGFFRLGIPDERSLVFCTADCFSLIAEENSSWSLRLLNKAAEPLNPGIFVRNVIVPPTWRRISAAWQGLDVVLAGWDGSGIVTARLQQDRLSGAWHLEQRFKVQPGAGLCYASARTCKRHAAETYADVQALQIGIEGQTLAVLHSGNRLDFWDLIDGAFLEQLDLGVAHRAMCHDDLELHLARQTPGGPVVEVLPLDSLEFLAGRRSSATMTPEKFET